MISFWSHFRRLLIRRPRPALIAAYWQITRRRVRARNTLRDATRGTDLAYDLWLKTQTERDTSAAPLTPGAIPTFSVLVHDCGEPESSACKRSLRSVEQHNDPSDVQILRGTDMRALLAEASGEYVFFLRCGDRLAGAALARLGRALAATPAEVVYSDEDHLQPGKSMRLPWFKPQWNAELFLALDFLSRAVAVRTALAREVAATINHFVPLTLDALLLRVTEAAKGAVLHLPSVLVHVGTQKKDPDERLAAVAAFLEGRAYCTAGPFDTVRVQWPLPEPAPSVSIVIPTRDKVELLRACVDGLLTRTDYPAVEILIVDNGSREEDALDYLGQLESHGQARILRCNDDYNFSSLNNLAVREATGRFILLLNNDTEVINPEWLGEMMRYAVRDEVGAVGAKLLYSDGSVQHAGVVVGMGEAAGHAHRHLGPGEPGYFRQPRCAQFVSAVTGACLLVDRRKYDAVGGLDERNFAIAYNDVDFCLKLEQAGWRNVYTPHAILYHHESKSRGNDLSPQHRERYMRELAALQERWGTKTFADPLHSVHLDRYSETYIPNLG